MADRRSATELANGYGGGRWIQVFSSEQFISVYEWSKNFYFYVLAIGATKIRRREDAKNMDLLLVAPNGNVLACVSFIIARANFYFLGAGVIKIE